MLCNDTANYTAFPRHIYTHPHTAVRGTGMGPRVYLTTEYSFEGNPLSSQERTQEQGRGCRPAAPSNINFKNTYFLGTMILIVLRDLFFSQNQPLNLAND